MTDDAEIVERELYRMHHDQGRGLPEYVWGEEHRIGCASQEWFHLRDGPKDCDCEYRYPDGKTPAQETDDSLRMLVGLMLGFLVGVLGALVGIFLWLTR